MVIRACLLAKIDRKAPRISTQPLMRSIVSHGEPFQMDLLELSTLESEKHLREKKENSKVLTASLNIYITKHNAKRTGIIQELE